MEKRQSTISKSMPAKSWLLWVVLFLINFGIYANSLSNGLLFDDSVIIAGDDRVQNFEWQKFLSEPYWPTEVYDDLLYRPVVSISFALNWKLASFFDESLHEVIIRSPNVILHTVVCVLVFVLSFRLFRNQFISWVSAILFAIHPIHSEVINSVVGRSDIVVTIMTLLASIYWLKLHDVIQPASLEDQNDEQTKNIFFPILGIVICLATGLFSKESAITILGVFVAIDIWLIRQGGISNLLQWVKNKILFGYAPALLTVGGYLFIRVSVLGRITNESTIFRPDNPMASTGEFVDENGVPLLIRFATPLYTHAKAIGMMFWPEPLIHDYSYPSITEIQHWTDVRLYVGLFVMVFTISVMLFSLRKKGNFFLSLCFWFIPYSIVSNFVVLIGTVFGERLFYAPSVGIMFAFGLFLHFFLFSKERTDSVEKLTVQQKVSLGIMTCIGILACYQTIDRNRDWKDNYTLVASVSEEDASFKVLSAIAQRYMEEGDTFKEKGKISKAYEKYDTALEYARRAKEAAPEAWGPYKTIAMLRLKKGNKKGALASFKKALIYDGAADSYIRRESFNLFIQYKELKNAIEIIKAEAKLNPKKAQEFTLIIKQNFPDHHLVKAL